MTCRIFPLYALFLLTGLTSCVSVPKGHFGSGVPEAPDYQDPRYWAALPDRSDNADKVPVEPWRDNQATAAADVFFLHPTTYTGKPGQNQWNANLRDPKVNQLTDDMPIQYQASVFNGIARVYAPRYRQAHLNCFYTRLVRDAEQALDLAYTDVRAAFEYYLQHYNQGRPFIIASHSQGTYHAKRLIRDFIDGQPLQKQFIVAYMAGLTVPSDLYTNIRPCQRPDEIGCFCSWRTFREGYIPPKLHFPDTNFVVTNPVTWDASKPEADASQNLGGVLRDFNRVYPQLVRTQVYQDLLWVNKPRFPWSFLLTTKNYHIADYNFFYADIRKNAEDRVNAFLGKR